MQKKGALSAKVIIVIILILLVLVILMLFVTGTFREVFATISNYLVGAKDATAPLKNLP